MLNKVLKRNIITAYLISVPLGIFAILFVFALPVLITDEGLGMILIITTYGWATLGLFLSFLASIWYGSKKAHERLLNGKKLLSTSFKFSLTINTIIWLTFIIIAIINNLHMKYQLSFIRDNTSDYGLFNLIYFIVLPLTAFIISVTGTTFTIGLLIIYIFDKNIKKSKVLSETTG